MISRTMSRNPRTRASSRRENFRPSPKRGRSGGFGRVHAISYGRQPSAVRHLRLIIKAKVQQAPVDKEPGEADACERNQCL